MHRTFKHVQTHIHVWPTPGIRSLQRVRCQTGAMEAILPEDYLVEPGSELAVISLLDQSAPPPSCEQPELEC